jgi:hypothetical protein
MRVCHTSAGRREPTRFSPDSRSHAAKANAHAVFEDCAAPLDLATKDELKEAEEAWLQTKVVSRKRYESVLRLLEIFAQHLGMVANQSVIQGDQAEPASIKRARQFILEHRAEELSLATVAESHGDQFHRPPCPCASRQSEGATAEPERPRERGRFRRRFSLLRTLIAFSNHTWASREASIASRCRRLLRRSLAGLRGIAIPNQFN